MSDSWVYYHPERDEIFIAMFLGRTCIIETEDTAEIFVRSKSYMQWLLAEEGCVCLGEL